MLAPISLGFSSQKAWPSFLTSQPYALRAERALSPVWIRAEHVFKAGVERERRRHSRREATSSSSLYREVTECCVSKMSNLRVFLTVSRAGQTFLIFPDLTVPSYRYVEHCGSHTQGKSQLMAAPIVSNRWNVEWLRDENESQSQ